MALTLTPLAGIPMVQSGDDLVKLTIQSLKHSGIALKDGDILVYAQKIISKVEDRIIRFSDVTPSSEAAVLAEETGKEPELVELILQESRGVVRSRPGLIVVEHNLGFICANAGIDRSNVGEEESALLLPKDPDASAEKLRAGIKEHTGAEIGILIIDSHGRAWREGTVGITIGTALVPMLSDQRGDADLFGRELKATIIGAADELAAGASLVMGQAAEGTPVVHVSGFPYTLSPSTLADVIRPEGNDLFR